MLKYKLVEENDTEIVYEYFPEGDRFSGIVVYGTRTGDCTIKQLAPNDKHQIYALKMIKKIIEFARNHSFAKNGIVAWY